MAIVWTVGMALALIFGATLFTMERQRRTAAMEKIDLLLTAVAQQREENLANELFAGHLEALQYSLAAMLEVKGVAAVAIYDLSGHAVLRTADFITPQLLPALLERLEEEPLFLLFGTERTEYALHAAPLAALGERVGYLALYSDLSPLERETTLYLTLFAATILAGVIMTSGMLQFLLTRLVLKPLEALKNGIANVQAGRLGERVPLEGEDEIGALAKAFNEMSARLQQQQASLRESEERYRAIYEHAAEGICQTSGDGRFQGMNKAMARILGYSSAEEAMASEQNKQGQFYFQLEQRREIKQLLKERGQAKAFEACFTRRDGTLIWVLINANAVFNARGEIARIDALVSDITERKLAEEEVRKYRDHLEKLVAERTQELSRRNRELALEVEQRKKAQAELLVAKQEAEVASQAKSNFLAVMSHEIRTPMNAILGMADMLMDTELTQEQHGYVELFRSAGKGLMAVLNDILDLSKVESGRLELENVDFNLLELLQEAMEFATPMAQGKKLGLRLEVDEDLPVLVHGDPTRLRQVLNNLLGNAIKFTAAGEVVCRVRPAQEPPASHWFTVSDTGLGIPAEKLDDIFESFSQADNSITRKFGGTGLGLSISRWLVQLMDGRIWAESEPDKGSDFHFAVELPPQNGAEAGSRHEVLELSDVRLPPLRVLLVEDSEYNALLVASFFKRTPFSLDIAVNGRIGVEKFTANEYDVVLMDVQMPEMDGLEATRAIRRIESENPGRKRTPIIALTAHVLKPDVERCREAGCDAHVAKPVSWENLLATILEQTLPELFTGKTVEGDSDTPGEAAHPVSEPAKPASSSDMVRVPEELKDIVPRFLQVMEEQAQMIMAQAPPENFKRVREAAHLMQGEGKAYGFGPVSEYGLRISEAAKARDAATVETLAGKLLAYLREVEWE